MALVTYRGIKYDTENRPNQKKCETKTFVQSYRGVKHTEVKTVCV